MATAIITVGRYTLISQQVVCSMLVADRIKSDNTLKLIPEVDRRLYSHFNWRNSVVSRALFSF